MSNARCLVVVLLMGVVLVPLGIAAPANVDTLLCPPLDKRGHRFDLFELDWWADTNFVVRKDSSGEKIWSVPIPGSVGSINVPEIVWDDERVYFAHGEGITCLDAATGSYIWHSEPGDFTLALFSGNLYSTGHLRESESEEWRLWLFARDPLTGEIRYRSRLPDNVMRPNPLEKRGDQILVKQMYKDEDAEGGALCELDGTIRYVFTRQLIDAMSFGNDFVVMEPKGFKRLSDTGEVIWESENTNWGESGEFIALPDGKYLAYSWASWDWGGAYLTAIDLDTGQVGWRANSSIDPGVVTGSYRQNVTVWINRDRVVVRCCGSQAWVTEIFHAQNGLVVQRIEQRKRASVR